MDKFISTLDEYFGKKAPQLPKGVKDFIVKFSPYFAILGVVFFGLALIPLINFLTTGYGPMGAIAGYVSMTNVYVSLAILAVVEILYLMAIPGLFKRTKKAWNLMFYAQLVGAVSSLASSNIIGMVIGLVIGFYFLFQVRSYYTK